MHAHPDALMPALAALPPRRRGRLGGADRGGARRLAGEPRHAAAARRARHGRGGRATCRRCCRPDAILTNGAGNFADLDQQALRASPAASACSRRSRARWATACRRRSPPRSPARSACVVCDRRRRRLPDDLQELGAALQAGALADRADRQQRAATARSACTRSGTIPAGSASPTSSTPTSWRWPRPTAFHAERVTRTADFPAAFARALASRRPARCSSSSSTPRA